MCDTLKIRPNVSMATDFRAAAMQHRVISQPPCMRAICGTGKTEPLMRLRASITFWIASMQVQPHRQLYVPVMIYNVLANLVLLIHALFVAFVVFGSLLVLRIPKLSWLHLPALAWGAAVVAMGWICPLTPLENALRRMAGQQGYSGGFIEYYVTSAIYPDGLTREIQILLATLLIIGNVAVYAAVYRKKRAV